jgi:hypothetical protein
MKSSEATVKTRNYKDFRETRAFSGMREAAAKSLEIPRGTVGQRDFGSGEGVVVAGVDRPL